jgi:hypothetical protein
MAVLVVAGAQIRALEEAQFERFVHRLAKHLRQSFGDELNHRSDEELLAAVRRFSNTAKLFGIELQDDLRRYAELSAKYGDRMHEDRRYPWIGRVLTSNSMSGTAKMDMLDWLELQIPPAG